MMLGMQNAPSLHRKPLWLSISHRKFSRNVVEKLKVPTNKSCFIPEAWADGVVTLDLTAVLDWKNRIVSYCVSCSEARSRGRVLYPWMQFDRCIVLQPTSKSGLIDGIGIWPNLIACLENVQGGNQGLWFPSNPQASAEAFVKHLSWSVGYSKITKR